MAKNKIINQKYIVKVNNFEETTKLPSLFIAKNKKEARKRIKPYHTNETGKVIWVPLLIWKRFTIYLKKKLRKLRRKSY